MALSIVPYVGLMNLVAQYLYPAYCSLQAFETSPTPREYAQWICYWIICAAWVVLDNNVLVYVEDYIPLFQEAKLLALLWLVHPGFHGAAYLWFGHLKKHHQKFEADHHHKIMGYLGPLGMEAAKETVNEAKEVLKEAKETNAGKEELKEAEKAVLEAKEAEYEAEEENDGPPEPADAKEAPKEAKETHAGKEELEEAEKAVREAKEAEYKAEEENDGSPEPADVN